MEIKINLDLEAAIANALTPENLGPILNKHVTEAITSAIRDATDYNSDFRKLLKTQIAETMPHGLGLDDVMKFQHVLNAAFKDAVHGFNSETVNTALAEAAKAALPDVPAIVSMTELLSMARSSFGIEERSAFYALYEQSEYGGGGHLYLDGNPELGKSSYGISSRRENSKYSAEINLAFNKEGEVYSLKFRGAQVTPSSRPTVITKFDSVLMSMYVGRTKLNADISPDDAEYAARDQYDD